MNTSQEHNTPPSGVHTPTGTSDGELITFRVAGAFWWGLGWRSFLVAFPFAFIGGFVGALFFREDQSARAIVSLLANLMIIPAYFFILLHVLRHGISGYSIKIYRR